MDFHYILNFFKYHHLRVVVDGKPRTHELRTSDVPFRRSIVVRGKGLIIKILLWIGVGEQYL